MRADRDALERQITDAVCRITIKGGLQAATFREVAAEAGVSVRLVQYYFGTKDRLLLATQRRCRGAPSVERIQRLRAGGSDAPVEVLRTIMRSFIPVDDESRDAMLMFVALFTASLLDPVLKRPEAAAPPASMRDAFAEQLRRGRAARRNRSRQGGARLARDGGRTVRGCARRLRSQIQMRRRRARTDRCHVGLAVESAAREWASGL